MSFIDQLIDDKKALSEKCEKLVTQMKEMERKYTMNSKTMEERHSIELERQKDNLIQAEKSRRERWIQEQSKKIKVLKYTMHVSMSVYHCVMYRR